MGRRQNHKTLSSKRPRSHQDQSNETTSTTRDRVERSSDHSDSQGDEEVSLETGMPGVGMSVAVTLAIFAVYMKTLHPSIPGGDSGELIIAANELGVAHPPGYPIFTLAGKLAIVCIPFGNPAWRVSVLNAGFAASAAGVLYLTVFRLTRSNASAMLTSGLFALSRLTWTWSVTAEVFGLNNLFVAVILLLAIKFDRVKKDEQQAITMSKLGAFVCGLSLCNQHTIILYVMVIAAWVIITLYKRQMLSMAVLVHIGLCFGAGLSPYLYMPLSSWIHKARWTWGDQTSIEGFLTHILRVEYGTFDLGKDSVGQGFIVGFVNYENRQ